jgi:transcriptional regulator with XRE-family HTH domain
MMSKASPRFGKALSPSKISRHRLTTWRFENGVTLAALALDVHASVSFLSSLELGRNVASEELSLKLAKVTGLPETVFRPPCRSVECLRGLTDER